MNVFAKLEQWSNRFAGIRKERRRRKIVDLLADCGLARELGAAHPDRTHGAVIRREALRREMELLQEAMELDCVRRALAALHPSSTAARVVGAKAGEKAED